MLRRLAQSLFGAGRRVAGVGSGFVDTFLRDNKVIPVVLALLALCVFAWIVAGAFLRGPDEEPVSDRDQIAQIEDPGAADPPSPEVENPNIDSYAAYQFKDPFRQLVAPAETTAATTPTTVPVATPATTPATTPTTTPTTTPQDAPENGGGRGGPDSDGDGVSDRREANLGLDPADPDSDADGTPDGQDDELPGRGDAGDDGSGGGPRGDGRGAGDGGGRQDLPESGGRIPSP